MLNKTQQTRQQKPRWLKSQNAQCKMHNHMMMSNSLCRLLTTTMAALKQHKFNEFARQQRLKLGGPSRHCCSAGVRVAGPATTMSYTTPSTQITTNKHTNQFCLDRDCVRSFAENLRCWRAWTAATITTMHRTQHIDWLRSVVSHQDQVVWWWHLSESCLTRHICWMSMTNTLTTQHWCDWMDWHTTTTCTLHIIK